MSVPFHIPDNLDGDMLSRFVIQRSDHLTETSLTDHLQNLVSECTQKFSILYTRKRVNNVDKRGCKKGEKKSALV